MHLLSSLVMAVAMAGVAQAEPVLERVVMVARHGVRAPTASLEALQAQTGRAWPAWPVGPGELTAHGAEALGRMADFVRETYADKGLLPKGACPAPGTVQVWADGADQRTRESGAVWAKALNCSIPPEHGPDGESDALFDAAGMGVCPVDAKAGEAAIRAATQDLADLERPEDKAALARLQTLVAPDGCSRSAGPCFTSPNVLSPGKAGLKLSGPLASGSTLAENLLLEYTQGLPLDQVGWGALGNTDLEVERTLALILPAHARAASLMRRTPYFASHNGVVLAHTVLDLLQGQPPQDSHAPKLSGSARLILIAGHDTNLSNLAGVFGLNWSLPGEPDATAPDTTLAFEVWRDGDTKTVRVVVYSQSLGQLRTAAVLDYAHPAEVTPAPLPDCDQGRIGFCGLTTLIRVTQSRLPAECKP